MKFICLNQYNLCVGLITSILWFLLKIMYQIWIKMIIQFIEMNSCFVFKISLIFISIFNVFNEVIQSIGGSQPFSWRSQRRSVARCDPSSALRPSAWAGPHRRTCSFRWPSRAGWFRSMWATNFLWCTWCNLPTGKLSLHHSCELKSTGHCFFLLELPGIGPLTADISFLWMWIPHVVSRPPESAWLIKYMRFLESAGENF